MVLRLICYRSKGLPLAHILFCHKLKCGHNKTLIINQAETLYFGGISDEFQGGIAQRSEQAAHNCLVHGSNPCAPTFPLKFHFQSGWSGFFFFLGSACCLGRGQDLNLLGVENFYLGFFFILFQASCDADFLTDPFFHLADLIKNNGK